SLGIVRAAVVFGMDRHHRTAASVCCAKAGGKTCDAALDGEAGFFQKRSHQLGGLELLHAELAEIENAVTKKRDRPRIAVEIIEKKLLLSRKIFPPRHDFFSRRDASAERRKPCSSRRAPARVGARLGRY